ncbi:MAG: SPOR domain-containing protein [Gammaproteobacteria bacterium]|nr:SPOR domain-containing protein [Gammaproteobacteria bacterium]
MCHRLKGLAAIVAMVSVWFSSASWADVNSGSQAYDRGDYETARATLSEEGTANNRRAQFLLGLMHANGEGGPRDAESAVVWLEKSAAQGYQPAKHALAALRARGTSGGSRDARAQAPTPAPDVKMPATQETMPKKVMAEETMAPKPSMTQIAASNGAFLLQIGAFRSSDAAARHWREVQSKGGDWVSDVAVDYSQGTASGGSSIHRVRVGPFSSSAAARARCGSLRDNGVVAGCFVVAR